jgi:hypothetical protein
LLRNRVQIKTTRKPTWKRKSAFSLGLAIASVLIFSLTISNIAGLSWRPFEIESPPLDVSVSNAQSNILQVPYSAQGNTNWCYQSALSMVLRYNHKAVLPADIARSKNQSPNAATNLVDILFGPVGSYVSNWPDLKFHSTLGSWSFEQFKYFIDKNKEPVIVSTFGKRGHTIVVVGYSIEHGQKYLLIHDSSGTFTLAKWNLRSKTYAKVRWERFSQSDWLETYITHT